jgi:uncharacterized protein YbjT (DUF2867 family)
VRSSALGAGPEGIQLGRWHYEVEKAVEVPQTIKEHNAFYTSIGSAKVSYIDTRDISAVAAKCLTEGGHEGQHIAELISRAVAEKFNT